MKLFFIILYIVVINLISFFVMWIDKSRARHKGWRIPEVVLLLIDLLGGSIGGIIAMDFLPHKSKHLLFSIGLPLMVIVEYGAFAVWFYLHRFEFLL
ncbi:MAG: DUF1294 domain-containing protein [Clostridia bacterium]|nr:DUF1294 domain-containing protein [Clostridia bacterium]